MGNQRDLTAQWMTGIGLIFVGAVLFLASALSLGIQLHHLRYQVQFAEHKQFLVLQARGIEEDLDDAEAAARQYVASGDAATQVLMGTEDNNAKRRLGELLWETRDDVDELNALKAIAPLVEAQIATYREGKFSDTGSAALAEFRNQQAAALEHYRVTTDRQFMAFIVLTSILALIAPAFCFVGLTLLQRDRGDRKARALQSELMHVQRLAVMGETAAMLAHEVSHPLSAASNYLAVLRRLAAQGDTAKLVDLSDRAALQLHRAATILHRLRRFIEKREAERVPTSPAVLIQDAVALIGPLDSAITLVTSVDDNLPDVAIDRVQIQQVLVNLMRNAFDAMQGSAERRLTIAAHAMATGGVEFSLADTGHGLTTEVAAKLFQPFVTTKKEGLGVGLSICRSIIVDHRGTIWAEPNPHGGTVFRFRLPAA